MMALRFKLVWCHFLLLTSWATFTSLTVVRAEEPSAGSQEAEKRSPHMYSFGLGKKSTSLNSADDATNSEGAASFENDGLFDEEDEEYFYPRDLRDPGRYAFGLGKRDRNNRFAFGLGKRPDPVNRFAFGLGKRPEPGNRFAFGLGKRFEPGNRFAFGLGKRPDSVNRFAFGLGKRPDVGHRFAFGLGKRDSLVDADDTNKRFIPDVEDYMKRRYSFGLGKRNNRYAFGLGRKKREPDSTMMDKPTKQDKST